MAQRPARETVDLSAYPNLVIIYLGMRVNAFRGLKTLLGFGPKIAAAAAAKPDGLLLHEDVLYSLRHFGMREYWRDFEALERWSRSEPHRLWWQQFLRDSGGTGFWHETYFRRGGIEAIYVDMQTPAGMARFAPLVAARGPMFSARRRSALAGDTVGPEPVPEEELYS